MKSPPWLIYRPASRTSHNSWRLYHTVDHWSLSDENQDRSPPTSWLCTPGLCPAYPGPGTRSSSQNTGSDHRLRAPRRSRSFFPWAWKAQLVSKIREIENKIRSWTNLEYLFHLTEIIIVDLYSLTPANRWYFPACQETETRIIMSSPGDVIFLHLIEKQHHYQAK